MADQASARRRVVLADFKAKKEKDGVDLETDDGTVFTIPPPELWPDEAVDNMDKNPLEAAKALLGDRYADFKAKGGSAALLISIVVDAHDLPAGE